MNRGPLILRTCRTKSQHVCRAFADSKVLKEERRDALFAEIRGDERLGYAIESVSAAFISAKMLQRCASLLLHQCQHVAHDAGCPCSALAVLQNTHQSGA